ncbi:MAG: hypothetical protein AAFN59_10275 [Pseudomonadota bacterium]
MNTSKIDPSKLLGYKLTVAEEAANAVIGIKAGDKMGAKEGKSGLKAGTKAGGKLLKAGVMQGKVSLRPV